MILFNFLFSIYIITLIFFIYGTIRLKKKSFSNLNKGISIIIAIRDGGISVNNIINDLSNQDYLGPIEFILVDDNSSDNTKMDILKISEVDSRFSYISSTQHTSKLTLKKRALDAGIKATKYDYMLFTDVDCRLGPSWVSTMASSFDQGYDYIVGFSIPKGSKGFNIISSFQIIDFSLLMIMCRASSYFNSPWASSGQNQGFTKELYNRVGGFESVNYFIGDDTPFLQLCKKYGAIVDFVDNPSSKVYSRTESKLISFINQRVRWVSDANKLWKLNIPFFLILLTTFIFYFEIIVYLFFFEYNFNIILCLLIKALFELILLHLGNIKLSLKTNLLNFMVWELFHIPYIVIIGTLSYFINFFHWRGRSIT